MPSSLSHRRQVPSGHPAVPCDRLPAHTRHRRDATRPGDGDEPASRTGARSGTTAVPAIAKCRNPLIV